MKIIFISMFFIFSFLSCKYENNQEVKQGEAIVQTGKAYNAQQAKNTVLPNYNFVDLDGQTYTKENTKGKIVVLKCWYINCAPCVAEIPTLNRIKGEYEGRNDILFLSLCLDTPNDLKSFLKDNVFDYKHIASQKKYLTNQLKIDRYPTHFVINKQGFILIKTNEYSEMTDILKKEAERFPPAKAGGN